MNTKIYFDESGNTGQDLLHQEQKIFVLSSVYYSENEMAKLKAIFDVDGELHFKKLRKSEQGRKQIIELINHSLITSSNIAVSISNKEFVVICQIIDRLVEPIFYDLGIDIYKANINIIFSNILFYEGQFWKEDFYKNMMSLFIDMIREKSQETIEKFYAHMTKVYQKHKGENASLCLIIEAILQSKNSINEILEHIDIYGIDVTLSNFVVLCQLWHNALDKKIDILFDKSKQIDHYSEYIKFLKDMNTPKTKVGFGEKTMIFPLQIDSIATIDSSNNIGIQIADLVASSIAFIFNNTNPKHEPFRNLIMNSKIFDGGCRIHSIFPLDEDETKKLVSNSEINGVNPLDFLAEKWIEYKK